MVLKYKRDPLSNLIIIDECHLDFAIRNQSNMQKCCIMSLSREWCECNDYTPIYKYILPSNMIVDKGFSYLLNFLPSVSEPNGFMHPLDAHKLCNYLNEGPNDGPNKDPYKSSNGGSNDGPNNGGDLLKEMLLEISN